MFLVVVDAYSKWPKVVEMHSGPARFSAVRTVEELRRPFSTHAAVGVRQWPSQQLAEFLKMNGIKVHHTTWLLMVL